MKSTLLSLFVLIATYVSGQVIERSMDMSNGTKDGLEADLIVDHKRAEKLWKDYMKPYGKVEWDRVNKEHVTFLAKIERVAATPVSVIAKFVASGDGAKGRFWIKLDSTIISSSTHTDMVRDAAEFIQEFAYHCQRWSIGEELKNAEKDLKKKNNDLKKLVKKKKSLHKNIENKKKDIAKWEHESTANDTALDTLEAGDSSGKDYEKDLKKLRKKKENLINDIAKGEKEILKWKNEISDNKKDRKNKESEIKDQESVVKEIKERLDNVGK